MKRRKKHSKRYIMKRSAGGYWESKKEKLLKRYKNLTERDLRFNLGSEDEMIEL
jgi:hypothetical protein